MRRATAVRVESCVTPHCCNGQRNIAGSGSAQQRQPSKATAHHPMHTTYNDDATHSLSLPSTALPTQTTQSRNGPEEDDSLPPLPEGLIPYDGKKPAPEIEEEPKPQQPTKPQPKPQKQPQSAKPQPAAAAAKTPVDDPALDPVLPEGLIPYDHRTTRQLLEEEDSDIGGVLAVAAVPAMPAGIGAMAAAVLESGSLGSSSSDATTPGAYGSGASSHGRSLLETPGGYGGGRSLLGMDDVTVGGYGGRSLLGMDGAEGSVGGYGGRSLLGEQQQPDKKKQEQQAAAPKKQDKAAAKPSTPPKADHKRPSPPPVSATTTAAAKTTSSPPAPCSAASNGTSSSLAANGRPFSTCYCRYNTKDSSWALEQAACRAALFSRCQSAGPLLECSQVDAFYRGLSMPGSEEIPHKEALETFLYTDCPPAPPCSCRGLLTGSETPTARSRCCADLQAHCQVPFSGLDCEDVGRFCRAGRQTSDPVGALFSWVLVKTQGFDCGSPKYAVSYTSVVSASSGARSIGADDAIRQLSKAAMFEGLTRYDYSETDRMAALLTMLIGGCFAVAVAAVGVGVIFRIVSTRNHHSAPLLERL